MGSRRLLETNRHVKRDREKETETEREGGKQGEREREDNAENLKLKS